LEYLKIQCLDLTSCLGGSKDEIVEVSLLELPILQFVYVILIFKQTFTFMLKVDYLIVGQGMAGTLLAYFLLKRNKEIFIIDQFNPSSASMVGAGLFNPITGSRNVKTWMADVIFPFAEKAYLNIELFLNQSFYHKINLIKMPVGGQSQDNMRNRTDIQEIAHYLVDVEHIPFNVNGEINTSDSIEITGTGYIDMSALIIAFRKKMLLEKRLAESEFAVNELKFEEDLIFWKDIRATKIIFCEGYKAIQNHYFSWLPFVPAKGELFTIHSKELKLDKILNKGIFVLPLGDDKYRVGSTYTWSDLDETPTVGGEKELCEKLRELIPFTFRILDHKAGIRPTVKDRKPLLGLHPVKRNIGIFNGLGTKGSTLAPYFANHFVEYLEENKALERTVDIRRFYALH